MKKIYIDDFPLNSGHAIRGMGMYTRNLISNINSLLKDSNEFKLSKTDYNLIHYPYFDLFFNTLKIDMSVKNVVTVPDVIPLLYPKHYPPGLKGKVRFLMQKKELKKADAIITISETSKKDIVRFLDIDPEKIYVTYLAPNFKFTKLKSSKVKLPTRFVLYIGDVNYNKNILTLVKACKLAKLKLVIVGKQAVEANYDRNHIENASLKELQDKYGNDKDIIRLGFLSNTDLNYVWNKATLYCQPSLYEGFGLPVLEAMQAGVPVLSSRTQALVEVAENAAKFFDPKSTKDLTQKLKLLMGDTKKRDELIKKGKERVKQFSWERAAKETLDVYRRVLQ